MTEASLDMWIKCLSRENTENKVNQELSSFQTEKQEWAALFLKEEKARFEMYKQLPFADSFFVEPSRRRWYIARSS